MITVHDREAIAFNNLGLGVLKDCTGDPIITEVLNGEYILEFEYALNGLNAVHLQSENIVKASGQLFVIENVKKSKTITVLAKHIALSNMSKNFLEDVAPTNQTSQSALQWIIERTQFACELTATGNVVGTNSARYVRKNLVDAVYNEENAILKRFGGELEFDNLKIYVHNKRASDKTFELREGKNINGVNYNIDFSTVITRILPQGNDGLLLPEKYIDSPIINEYVKPMVKKIEFNIGISEEDGRVVTEEQAYEMMRDECYKMYQASVDVPQVSISIDFLELSKTEEYKKYANIESAHLGDNVRAYVPFLNLDVSTRIVKTKYNVAKKRYIAFELGTIMPTISSNSTSIEQKIEDAVNNVNASSILIQAQKNATTLLKHPFGGYIYIDENAGEMYLMDTKDVATATKLWKFGIGGIGYSPNGFNGDFELAITNDGQIVADFITAGTMSANIINGGILKLGNTLNESGKIEVYDEMNRVVSTYDKDGLKIYHENGNVIVANQKEFAGYNKDGQKTFEASEDVFMMNKADVKKQIDIGEQVRLLYIKNGSNVGIGIVPIV